MCTLQELKDSNNKEHSEIKSDVKSMKASIKMLFIALTVTLTLIMIFSGAGANYQRLTYEEKVSSNDMLDKLQDSINIHWTTSMSVYKTILIPNTIRLDSHELRIERNEKDISMIKENSMITHGIK